MEALVLEVRSNCFRIFAPELIEREAYACTEKVDWLASASGEWPAHFLSAVETELPFRPTQVSYRRLGCPSYILGRAFF